MTSYTTVFGDNTIPPTQVMYLLLNSSDNYESTINLHWPFTSTSDSSNQVLAAVIKAAGDFGGDLTLVLPDATAGSNGYSTLFINDSNDQLVIMSAIGDVAAVVASGAVVYLYLQTNESPENSAWGAFTFGAFTANADAAQLAGAGLVAYAGELNTQGAVTVTSNSSYIVQASDRSTVLVSESSALEVQLMAPAQPEMNPSNGWYMDIVNAGSGATTVVVAGGSVTIDGLTSKVLAPTESARFYSDGDVYYSFAYGRSTQFNFTALVLDLTGLSGDITLSNAQASNKIIKFIGVPAGNIDIIFPAIVNVYFVQCAYTGGFGLELKTDGTSGVNVSSGDRVIIYCDGSEIVSAQTIAVGSTISIEDGSAAMPSLNFSADTDTGLFRATTNSLGIAAGGNQVATFTPTGMNATPIGATTKSTGAFTSITLDTALGVASGGTNITSYTIGDIIYASGATTLSKLADVATGNALISGGVGVAPAWGKVGLTTHISGTLPVANGGTNITSYTIGDILYASASGVLTKLPIGATGDVLNVVGGIPAWGATVLAPFVDSTAIIKGSADATKLFRIEVDGFTTATTRVMTPPNQNFTAAGIDVKETFTTQQTPFNGTLTDGATVNWDADVNGQVVTITTAASRTFAAPTNIVQNALYVLVITTGGFTPSWNAAYKWANAAVPSGLAGVCIFTFVGGATNTLLSTGYQVNVS